jgi:hypothetical protein
VRARARRVCAGVWCDACTEMWRFARSEMQTGRCTYGPIGRRRRRVREGELLKAMYRFGMSWCGCACRAVSRGCPRWAGRSMGRGERRRADRRHSYSGGTVNTPHTTTGRDTLEVRGPDSYRTDYRIRYKDLEKSKNKTPDGKYLVRCAPQRHRMCAMTPHPTERNSAWKI